MSERLSNNTTREANPDTEPFDPTDGAIEKALSGFAPDRGSWLNARTAFGETLAAGRSYNEALDQALGVASSTKNGPESTSVEAKMRFWDNMDPDPNEENGPTPAIDRALDGYARDGGMWLLGKQVFEDNIASGADIETALHAGLLAAGDGAETHPEVARDRFYGGVDPDYADADHINGRRYGLRVNRGPAKIEIGVGRDAGEKRRRRLGRLAARHSQR